MQLKFQATPGWARASLVPPSAKEGAGVSATMLADAHAQALPEVLPCDGFKSSVSASSVPSSLLTSRPFFALLSMVDIATRSAQQRNRYHSIPTKKNLHASFASKGFTLVELLVVITLVGILAIGVVMSVGGVEDDAAMQLTKTELGAIRKAVRQYKLDVGMYPDPVAHPADFSALVGSSAPTYLSEGLKQWNPDISRGWRGPYLSRDGNGLVDVGDDLDNDGTGSITTGTLVLNLPGVADAFVRAPSGNYLVWRDCIACEARTKWGRPFLLFDLDDTSAARVVSMGPDGLYAGRNPTDPCLPYGDDIVMCLL